MPVAFGPAVKSRAVWGVSIFSIVCACSSGLMPEGIPAQAPPADASATDAKDSAPTIPVEDAQRDPSPCCCPGPTTGFKPTWKPPAAHQDACTQAQIDGFYKGCIKTGATQQTCAPYGTNGTSSNQACAKCLFTASTASAYGPLIDVGGVVELNIAGCIAIDEGKLDGSGCGGAYQANSQCEDAMCKSNCPVTDDATFAAYQACVQQADATECQAYSNGAACAAAIEEAGAPGASCVSTQTFDDGYKAMAPIFCLNTSDASFDASDEGG
jgi:hypothetical protein